MRYRPEHKIKTHEKIVKDASRRVRAEGLNGAAVAAVMRDAGLTHGGFYKHFASKDELLIESLKKGFRDIIASLVHAAEQVASWGGVEGNCEGLPTSGNVRTSRTRLPPGDARSGLGSGR